MTARQDARGRRGDHFALTGMSQHLVNPTALSSSVSAASDRLMSMMKAISPLIRQAMPPTNSVAISQAISSRKIAVKNRRMIRRAQPNPDERDRRRTFFYVQFQTASRSR